MWMRGGTSKAAVFLADDLPTSTVERDEMLLSIMGSPDPRQIDGIGGATSLTSKVAVVSKSTAPGIDVDYLFLQVAVNENVVSDRQNCGNILAAIGPFAVERGLVQATGPEAAVRIRMVNSNTIATARFPLRDGMLRNDGEVHIAGVPGKAAGVRLYFEDTEGSATGALFPTGRVIDTIDGIDVTCVDNGMPVVLVAATDLGLSGQETPQELSDNERVTARVDALRQKAGHLMGLGATSNSSVPKTVAVSPPVHGGAVATRSFIPTRPHEAIGVFAAVSVITALLTPGAVAHELLSRHPAGTTSFDVEHPTGFLRVDAVMEPAQGAVGGLRVTRSGVVRTARKLMDGTVYPRHRLH
ncbi:4-oxalomesaconate tautomerase [Amycolatopsis sp. RM579]|uniref:4-oxalomesaconate tautomerase n=2 Tax=Amycolatopsis pithecellobii TaxID=664692 RepID=A0A6N7Z1J9_9PSEU|nr:4-oxalomesaconate tautomerase [Amycolatopsis pithecellobii]